LLQLRKRRQSSHMFQSFEQEIQAHVLGATPRQKIVSQRGRVDIGVVERVQTRREVRRGHKENQKCPKTKMSMLRQ